VSRGGGGGGGEERIAVLILKSTDETILQKKSKFLVWRGTTIWGSDETVIGMQVPGEVKRGGGGQQGAEKEDKLPATAADGRLAGRTAERWCLDKRIC
jgi:hypothetical protein